MTMHVSDSAAAYRCVNTGKCCWSFRIGVDPKKKEEIASRVADLPEYRGKELFAPGVPGSYLNREMLAREEEGRCVFHRAADKLCDLHARFGSQSKPLVCLQYPYISVVHPDGPRIGIVYSCPSSVRTLRESRRFEVLDNPPGISLPAFSKQVPADYPLWLEKDRAIAWDAFHAFESELLDRIQDRSIPLPEALFGTRMRLEELAGRGVGIADPVVPADHAVALQKRLVARFAERRGRLGISAGKTDLAVYRYLTGLLGEHETGGAWDPLDAESDGILRRYLCGKVFANILFIEQGLVAGLQGVLALYCLTGWVFRALRRIKDVGGVEGICEAIEQTDRNFPHDDRTFSLWSRKEAQYETLGLFYAKVLLA